VAGAGGGPVWGGWVVGEAEGQWEVLDDTPELGDSVG